jgi:hypothetical protein
MQITDEDSAQRIEDAGEHDQVMLMVGEPGTERPLIIFSVNKNGDAFIEYDPGDLAAGIRQLNALLSGSLRGTLETNGLRLVPAESRR